MQEATSFLVKSALVSGIMMGYYMLALRGKKMHAYNRAYLLTALIASIVIPFLHLNWYTVTETSQVSAIKMLQFINSGADETQPVSATTSTISASAILLVIYALASLALLLLTLRKTIWIFRLKRSGRIQQCSGYHLIYTDSPKAPFSFFGQLFWNKDIDPDSETGRRILHHELTHIQQMHTADKLAVQLALILCWANPFYWLLQKELSIVHEFLADENAIQDNDTASFAMMLLESHYKSALPVIINPFYSSIKRRIIMLNQTKNTRFKNLRRVVAVPMLAGLVLLLSTSAGKVTEISKASGKTMLILDPGHGGSDAGGAGQGLIEKDLNLRICNRLAQLASEYNVDVLLTRTGDEYPALSARTEMANRQTEGVFVSVHVNKSVPGEPRPDGIEIFVSGKNPRFGESKLLASAVSQHLQSGGTEPKLLEKGLWVLKGNMHPAILIECGNIDNAADMARLRDRDQMDKMCRNILSGIVAYSNDQKNGK